MRKKRVGQFAFVGPIQPIWQRGVFHTQDVNLDGVGDSWVGARRSLNAPFCWTPSKPFYFGGKRYVALYPCIAFATKNFGFVIQKGPNGMVLGRE